VVFQTEGEEIFCVGKTTKGEEGFIQTKGVYMGEEPPEYVFAFRPQHTKGQGENSSFFSIGGVLSSRI